MKSIVDNQVDIKQCKCGNVFVVNEGQVDYGYKDEWGKLISDQAAHHMAKNRINCS